MSDRADTTAATDPRADELVPVWLAVLVLLLLLALVGVAGYVIRARFSSSAPRTAADIAVEKAQTAVASSPSGKQGHLDLGFAYEQDGMYKQAIDEYDEVLKLDPKDTAALYNKGMVYFQLQDPKKAEELLWDVLKVSPTHVLAAKALGDYYAGKGEYRSLVVAVKPAADARPDMADLQYLMGLAYEHLGHKDWAAGRYRDALKYVPDLPEARAGLKRLGAAQ
jgi:tetratricopeptide (TPR) repeat protein